jgi:hypothetical protein
MQLERLRKTKAELDALRKVGSMTLGEVADKIITYEKGLTRIKEILVENEKEENLTHCYNKIYKIVMEELT